MMPLNAVRLSLGTAHLLYPRLGRELVPNKEIDWRARRVVQVLGARQIVQALLTSDGANRGVWYLGAEADIAHALSMVGVAITSRRWRRLALVDAAVACGLATIGWRVAKTAASGSSLHASHRAQTLRNQWADRAARVLVPGYPQRCSDEFGSRTSPSQFSFTGPVKRLGDVSMTSVAPVSALAIRRRVPSPWATVPEP
jgi:hypothetical protein